MKHDEAAKIVAVLFASYPHGKFDRDNARAYTDAILDLDAEACGPAVQRLIRTSRFLPSIAEIREAATAQQHGPCPRGEEAWAELQDACRKYGYDYGASDAAKRLRDPLFRAPHIEECLRLWGGWNAFATTDHDAASRARFCALYDERVQRQRRDLTSGIPLPASASPVLAALTASIGHPRPEVPPVPKGALESHHVPAMGIVPRQPPAPSKFRRRMTADEIDAELASAGDARG